MTKTIAFIDNFDEVEIFLKKFQSCTDKDTIYIAGDALAFEALKKRGIQCKAIDDYRNLKQYEEAEKYALDMAEKWFIDDRGNDFTEFNGISLGRSLKFSIFMYFNFVAKAILDVSNILKIENPKKVLLVHIGSVPNHLTGKRSIFLHKEVFLFFAKNKKYKVEMGGGKIYRIFSKLKNIISQFRFERQSILKGKVFYYCPVIFNLFAKKLIIMIVDQVKSVLLKNEKNLNAVCALTLSASDITFFGNELIESFLKKDNCYFFYMENENNCYFNSRILRVCKRKISSMNGNKKISEYIYNLKDRFEKIEKCEKRKPRWVFMNLALFNFIEKYLSVIIGKDIPELIKFILHTEYVIKKNNIKIALISERWGAKRIILTQVAKRNGIPVLHIPHSVEPGVKVGDKIFSSLTCDIKRFPFYPTHEISSIRYQQQMQIHRGISKGKLFLTGIPRFGNIDKKTQKDCDEARKRLNYSLDEEIVLFVIRGIFKPFYDKAITNNQISTFTLSYLYESFIKQFLERKNCRAVFKLKMLDDGSNWLINSLITKNESNNISIFKNHLIDLLIASDAVVVTHSSIGIEAIYHDTPVIVYNNPDKPSFLSLCAEGAALEIKSSEELIPILDKLLNDKIFKEKRLKIQRDFLQRNLPAGNLSAAERVSEVIMKLANHNKIGRNPK